MNQIIMFIFSIVKKAVWELLVDENNLMHVEEEEG